MIIYYRINKKFSKSINKIAVFFGKYIPFVKNLVLFHKPVSFQSLKNWVYVRNNLEKILSIKYKILFDIEDYEDINTKDNNEASIEGSERKIERKNTKKLTVNTKITN